MSFEAGGRADSEVGQAARRVNRDIYEIGKRIAGGDRDRYGRSWEHGVRDRYINLVESYKERRCPGEEDSSLLASEQHRHVRVGREAQGVGRTNSAIVSLATSIQRRTLQCRHDRCPILMPAP